MIACLLHFKLGGALATLALGSLPSRIAAKNSRSGNATPFTAM